MFAEPRAYREDRDLEKMQSLLVKGRQAANGSYYVHTGDLNWWLFYPSSARSWQDTIFLWEGSRVDGELDGWALLSPDRYTFDVFVHPDERGGQRAAQMYTWAEERIGTMVVHDCWSEIRTMWVGEDDEVLIAHLESRGFERGQAYMLSMQRPLAEPVPEIRLPSGWHVRPLGGEGEVHNRASASHAAFRSYMPFNAYWQRYLRFMRTPAYASALDLLAVSPKGRIAAFCLCWFDPANRVGLFEPVGTHPYYQQRGLGKAVILEGLKQMQARGMATATVITEGDNRKAQKLYWSAGFVPAHRLYTYKKPLRSDIPWQPKPSVR